MGKKANPAIIGAFVIGAVALAVVAVTVWGSGKLFRRQYPCVCYFPGSVNGLSAGAPVKFRGVQIGEVSDVRLLYAQTRGSPRIPVFLKIDNERMRGLGSKRELSLELLRELIDQGLRARLQTQSIVTGVLYVEFDLLPGTPVEMMQEPDAGYPEIPTLPTPLAEATKTVSDVLAQLKKVDFKGLGVAAREAVDGVNRLVSNPRMTAAVDGLPDARGMATKFYAPGDARTDIVAITLPCFFVRTPEDFVKFTRVQKPSPRSGKPRPLRVLGFLLRHREALPAVRGFQAQKPPASYATVVYNSIHSFKWLDADGGERFVRYRWVPEAGEESITKEEAKSRGADYLQDEIRTRLEQGPVRFRLQVRLAADGDAVDDPTKAWPESRETVEVGVLELTGLDTTREQGGDVLVFDPMRVTDGIEPSADPILHFRRAAYDVSVQRRAGVGLADTGMA